ncbi:MAG: MMPL family transporter [Chloroflexi bacterium]|nr:MMPL family transporter [Chloroflexota bacterium]
MRMSTVSNDQGLFERWARFAVRRRGVVLLSWLGALIALIVAAVSFGGGFTNSFELPGTESQQAFDLLKERFPQQSGDSATLVFKSDQGVSSPAIRQQIDRVLAQAATLPKVVEVGSLDAPGAVSADGRIARVNVQYSVRSNEVEKSESEQLTKLIDSANGNGLQAEAGGDVVQFNEQEEPGSSELFGIMAAVVILLIAFGSVVAMGLPLTTAIAGLVASFAFMAVSAQFLNLPFFTTSFAAMIGIGVGIDYALFIVTRFREGRRNGLSQEAAAIVAMTTAGRAVLFAGLVVAVALLGLIAMGIPFVTALGVAGAIVVAMAVITALTLLPALLGGWFGRNIDRWSIPFLHATDTADRSSMWYRLSTMIQRRPVLWFAGSLGLLLVLGTPVLRMNLGFSDAGNGSEKLHSRRAYDLLAEGFGPGFNAPFTVVFDTKGARGDVPGSLEQVRTAVANWPGVVEVSPPIPNPANDAFIVTAFTSFAPQDPALEQMVSDLRERALPPATSGTGIRAYVAGQTAAFIDIGDRIRERMPLFFGAVIGLSFLLLMAVFRSVVVPLKAAIMNLLSIGASFGVVVAIFQWGWGADLLGIKEGPIEIFMPMMLFAILFGLSMDYEVFLISRIREEYTRTGDNASAVAHGLTVTARVITAAAAIMVVVFLSFVLGPDRTIKQFGIGLATAIFVDATVVRLILVPATMELLGDANWWLPRWLDRALPNLDVEGAHHPEPVGVAAD